MPVSTTTDERSFLHTVTETLELFGYQCKHDYPLLTRERGWQTGSTAKGWPDIFAMRPPRILAIELKRAGRHAFPDEQRAWLSLFAEVPCCRAWLVTPTSPRWDTFVEWVQKPYPAPRIYGFEPMTVDEARNYLDQLRTRKPRRAAKPRRAR